MPEVTSDVPRTSNLRVASHLFSPLLAPTACSCKLNMNDLFSYMFGYLLCIYSRLSLTRTPRDRGDLYSLSGVRINRSTYVHSHI